MPTTLPRHTITETELVARALDEAAMRWPAEREARSRLLLHLIEAGYQAIQQERRARAAERREAIRRTSGVLAGVYPEGYLDELRSDWPE